MLSVPTVPIDTDDCAARVIADEEYICWSRMQAEAGQELQAIVRRKELERRAGGGFFFWGVGNAPSTAVGALARLRKPVSTIFSIMKGRPKLLDSKPSRTVAWRNYIDLDGNIRPLPSHVLITSRGDSPSGPKTRHYALVCWSDNALEIRHGRPFDPTAYRNAGGNGAPVGASQVTVLLKRSKGGAGYSQYEENLTAWLTGGYWVRLVDPIECTTSFAEIDTSGEFSENDWLAFVAATRGSDFKRISTDVSQGMLF